MMKLTVFLATLFTSLTAAAGEYSANVGLEWTSARATGGDAAGRLNGRFGLGLGYALGERWTFETGTDYVFRRVKWRRADGASVHVDFDYIDVPATLVARVAAGLRVFAGVRVAINVLDKAEVKRPTPSFDPVAHAVIVLGQVGVRVDLPRDFAVDAFFEREFGDFAGDLREYQTGGLRLVYVF